MIGRRPKRIRHRPSNGERRNCISPQTVANTPKISAAPAVSPSMKPSTIVGSTGIIETQRQHVQRHGAEDEGERRRRCSLRLVGAIARRRRKGDLAVISSLP